MGNPRLRLFLVLILAAVLLPVIAGCEHLAPVIVKNNTDKVLTIYEDATRLHQMPGRPKSLAGTVQPGEELRPEHIPSTFNTYVFEAIDAQGNIVYSKVFTRQELEDMNWEVTITESQ